jgi:predicted  nucleic acid-binding Zn-ribbon protein
MSGSLSALLRALHEAQQRIHLLSQEIDESQRAITRLQSQLQDRESNSSNCRKKSASSRLPFTIAKLPKSSSTKK